MSQPDGRDEHWVERLLGAMRASPVSRLLAIGAFVLLLQIPIFMIRGLVGEREATRQAAVAEVRSSWGGAQRLIGPGLVVPLRPLHPPPGLHGTPEQRELSDELAYVTFLPLELEVDAELRAETLHRGIFEVPVYRAGLDVRGVFPPPDAGSLGVSADRLLWDEAELVVGVGDVRRIQDGVRLRSGETELDFEPGTGHVFRVAYDIPALQRTLALFGTPPTAARGRPTEGQQRLRSGSGIHVALPRPLAESGMDFALRLELNGSERLSFAPLGSQTSVRLRGDWPDPSFQGAWLPGVRSVSAEGFEASWQVPDLGRGYSQQWAGDAELPAVFASLFGVELLTPVDAYRSTQRSLRYQLLFLGLTFLSLWLLEVLVGARVHPIQYGLIGAAMCLFYVLELSLAEHLGLGTAYALAASAVVSAVGAYARAILAGAGRAALVAGVLASLYAYLYVLLRIESYALLVGSLGLFAALVAVMYATRRIDWYALHPKS